jgi:hypothetical protein
MTNYSHYSTSYLLTQAGAKLSRQPTSKSTITTYKKFEALWFTDGPLSKEAEDNEAAIRRFCIEILNN